MSDVELTYLGKEKDHLSLLSCEYHLWHSLKGKANLPLS